MGPANTPESVMKFYRQLSLSKCSLNLIEIPRGVPMVFQDIYQHCVKNNMIPIGVYKRQDEQTSSSTKTENKADALGGRSEEKTQRKSYVWLHPPKQIELNIYDQLFVLCEKNEKENPHDAQKSKVDIGTGQGGSLGKNIKNEGKKIQNENLKELGKLNTKLKDLLYFSSELQDNFEKSGSLLQHDLGFKIKSGLESSEF